MAKPKAPKFECGPLCWYDVDTLTTAAWWYLDHTSADAINHIARLSDVSVKFKGYLMLMKEIDRVTDILAATSSWLGVATADQLPVNDRDRAFLVFAVNDEMLSTIRRILQSDLVSESKRGEEFNFFTRLEETADAAQLRTYSKSVATILEALSNTKPHLDVEEDEVTSFEEEATADIQVPRGRGLQEFDLGDVKPTMNMPRGKQ